MTTHAFLLNCDGGMLNDAPQPRERRLVDRCTEIITALHTLSQTAHWLAGAHDLNVVVAPEFFFGFWPLNQDEWEDVVATLRNISRANPNCLLVAGSAKWAASGKGGNTALVFHGGALQLTIPKRYQAGVGDTIVSGYGMNAPGINLPWAMGDPTHSVTSASTLQPSQCTVEGIRIGFDVCNDFRRKVLKDAPGRHTRPKLHIVVSAAFHVCDVDMDDSSPVEQNGYLLNCEYVYPTTQARDTNHLYKYKLAVRQRTGGGIGNPIAPAAYVAFANQQYILGAAAWTGLA